MPPKDTARDPGTLWIKDGQGMTLLGTVTAISLEMPVDRTETDYGRPLICETPHATIEGTMTITPRAWMELTGFARLLRQYAPSWRVADLALNAKKARIRKKNTRRILKRAARKEADR